MEVLRLIFRQYFRVLGEANNSVRRQKKILLRWQSYAFSYSLPPTYLLIFRTKVKEKKRGGGESQQLTRNPDP